MARIIPVIALALALPAAALADPTCDEKSHILAELQRQFAEVPTWAGTSSIGPLLITSSPAGTWTLLAVRPGPAGAVFVCLLLEGKDGAVLPIKPGEGA